MSCCRKMMKMVCLLSATLALIMGAVTLVVMLVEPRTAEHVAGEMSDKLVDDLSSWKDALGEQLSSFYGEMQKAEKLWLKQIRWTFHCAQAGGSDPECKNFDAAMNDAVVPMDVLAVEEKAAAAAPKPTVAATTTTVAPLKLAALAPFPILKAPVEKPVCYLWNNQYWPVDFQQYPEKGFPAHQNQAAFTVCGKPDCSENCPKEVVEFHCEALGRDWRHKSTAYWLKNPSSVMNNKNNNKPLQFLKNGPVVHVPHHHMMRQRCPKTLAPVSTALQQKIAFDKLKASAKKAERIAAAAHTSHKITFNHLPMPVFSMPKKKGPWTQTGSCSASDRETLLALQEQCHSTTSSAKAEETQQVTFSMHGRCALTEFDFQVTQLCQREQCQVDSANYGDCVTKCLTTAYPKLSTECATTFGEKGWVPCTYKKHQEAEKACSVPTKLEAPTAKVTRAPSCEDVLLKQCMPTLREATGIEELREPSEGFVQKYGPVVFTADAELLEEGAKAQQGDADKELIMYV